MEESEQNRREDVFLSTVGSVWVLEGYGRVCGRLNEEGCRRWTLRKGMERLQSRVEGRRVTETLRETREIGDMGKKRLKGS